MKANLILKNIGSHQGERKYNINSGKITIFEGANSSGKSTIIKSIATILSSPINSNNLKNEANNFGILPMDNRDSPLVNIFENDAKITLSYEDLNLEANILKNGTINTIFPENFQGNEIFLYTCMLLKNSKIQRYLASGDDNFQWIVSEMSYAGKYEEMNEINNSYIRLINAAKSTLKDVNKKIGHYIDENKNLKYKKKNQTTELKKVQGDIENLPPSKNPELKLLQEKESKLLKSIDTSKKRLENYKKEKIGKDFELKNISLDVDNLNIEIEKLDYESENLIKEIESIQNINSDNEYKNIMEQQELLKQVIEDLSEQKVLRELNNTILNARYESDTCPLCGNKIPMNKEKFSKKLKEIRKKIEDFTNKKTEIESNIKNSDNFIKTKRILPTKKNQLKKKSIEIGLKINNKKKIIDNTENIQNELKNIDSDTLREERAIKQNQEELKDIQKKVDIIRSEDKENSEIYQKEKRLLNEIHKLDVNIEKNNELIKEKSQLELFGINIPIEKTDQIINNLSDEFEEIELYLNEKITEQRTGAGKKFNSTINNIVKELKLEDFDDIYIDLEDYRLVVVRKGGKIQPLGALGGAERGIIGGILQISCKQTYLKEIPFFIGDDIILEFDPEMSETFMNYLKKLAVEDDLFIIITRISNSKQLKQVEI